MAPESLQRLAELGGHAFRAGLAARAARFYCQARKLAEETGDPYWRVHCLRWEGSRLREAGDDGLAMARLLQGDDEQGATICWRRSPTEDTRDVSRLVLRLASQCMSADLASV